MQKLGLDDEAVLELMAVLLVPAASLQPLILSTLLSASGYVGGSKSQVAEVDQAIRLATGIIPAIILLVGVIPLILLPINHKKELEIQAAIAALLVVATDPGGMPQVGLDLTFSASSGRLASGGVPVKTDSEGKAADTLRIYEDDPDTIEVSVSDGTRVTPITVKKVVVEPPVADAGDDQTVECTGHSSAMVLLDGKGSSDPNGDIVSYEWFEFFGQPGEKLLGAGDTLKVSLSVGPHVITLKVTDATGKTATDEVTVDVVDTTPPKVHLTVTPNRLWPPNHRMVRVHADRMQGLWSRVLTRLL